MTDLGTVRGMIRIDVRQAVAAYAAVRAQNARTVYALRGAGDSFVGAGKTMAYAGGVMVYAFSRVVNAAADFERKMDFFSAVSDTNAKKMQKLSDYTLQLAEDTIYSAEQIADGMIELGKAGVSAEQIMGGIGDAMANLGAAGDIDLAKSGQIITSTIQQFDLAARDAVKVTDLLAGAANASIADIDDIGVSLKYVGGVANAVGLGFEDTTTAISLLAKAGIRGSTAGTSLRQMLVSLGGATDPARKALKRLGIMSEDGVSNKFFTAEGKAKSLSEIFQILKKSTEDLTQKERLMELRTIFNNRALSAASILTRDGAKGFKDMNKEMSKVTAAEVASERLDNLSGDLEILQGNIETMMTKAGGPFQETLRGWVQDITKLIQAFDNLSPETQKMITQSVAMTGVFLLAMGALSIVIGSILRFVAASIKMAAGMKFVWKMLRIILANFKWFRILILGPVIGAIVAFIAANALIIAAVLAVVGVLVLLYKKWAPFRELVNSIAEALKRAGIAVWNFIKLLVKDPGAAWEKTKKAFWALVDMAKEAISKIPGILKNWLNIAIAQVKAFGGRVKDQFLAMGQRVINAVTGFVGRIIDLFTFHNIGKSFAIIWSTVIKFFALLPLRVIALVLKLVLGVVKWFGWMAPKIGYLLGFLIGRMVRLFIMMGAKILPIIGKMIMGILRFWAALPGRVASFVIRTAASVMGLFIRMAINAPRVIGNMIMAIVRFFQALPGRIIGFIVKIATRIPALLRTLKTKFIKLATGMIEGFVEGFKDLPETMSGIVDKMIQTVKDAATAAYNAVKDFAGGMWDGFKDGLGIHSPSHMERAMWQITGVLDTETKKLAKKTMQVQKLSKKMAETSFSVGENSFATPDRRGYADLASMHARNQNRARTLGERSGKRGDRPSKGSTTKNVKVETTVNNPKPERAGQSVSKVLKNKVEEAGWR